MSKAWSGRFTKETARNVEAFTASIHYDRRLYQHDIAASIVHCQMLGRQGIIPAADTHAIVAGLLRVHDEIESGALTLTAEREDIHMNVEGRLHELIGPVAGKLHTARSRNDQVATDMRLYAREVLGLTMRGVATLQEAFLDQAAHNVETIMPGYTHLQHAQPVLLAHHLLAYCEMLSRDFERLRDCLTRTNVLPLGSGALAGVTQALDRDWVAQRLGFQTISRNSMDAVTDRDFLLELLSACAILMMHLSRLAEELVLWSSAEFAFIELDDAYATGSSIMPQKKNPDVPELVRGKTGRVYGDLLALLTVMKGLPLTYNRDLQEDKEAVFDATETVLACLALLPEVISTMRIKKERLLDALRSDWSMATDYADYLAKKGLPFRQAHEVVGRLVQQCVSEKRSLEDLSLLELQQASSLFAADALTISIQSGLAARSVPGGTAPARVREALREARDRVGMADRFLQSLPVLDVRSLAAHEWQRTAL